MKPGVRGIWIVHSQLEQPDVIVYYCHGECPEGSIRYKAVNSHVTKAVVSPWAQATSTWSFCLHG
jgi:hypothetical protein